MKKYMVLTWIVLLSESTHPGCSTCRNTPIESVDAIATDSAAAVDSAIIPDKIPNVDQDRGTKDLGTSPSDPGNQPAPKCLDLEPPSPEEGSPCTVPGQTRCSELDRHEVTLMPGKLVDTHYWTCIRPFMLQCVKDSTGSLAWVRRPCPAVAEGCGGIDLIAEPACQENARGAFCCPSKIVTDQGTLHETSAYYSDGHEGPRLCDSGWSGTSVCSEYIAMPQIARCTFQDQAIQFDRNAPLFTKCGGAGSSCLYWYVVEECAIVGCLPGFRHSSQCECLTDSKGEEANCLKECKK